MATIKDLREKMAKIATEARSKYNEITDKTKDSEAEAIEAEFDRMMVDHDKIGQQVERLQKLEAAERAMAEPITPAAREGNAQARGVDGGDGVTYRQAFHSYLRAVASGAAGQISADERAVLNAGFATLSPEERAQTTTNAAGGYSIPEEMMERVIVSMKAWGPMYDGNVVTELVTAGGNAMPFPTVNDTAVTAGAHTEGATLTDDGGKDITFGTKQLDAYAFDTEWIRVSKELADDSFIAMEQFVGARLGERLARIANLQLTTGSGSSAPNGIVTASTLGVTAAGAAAVTSDELLDLEHSVDPAYRNGPRVGYMFNDTTLKAVRKLKDGDGNYLWQMGNIQAGIPSTLNGRPFWINQDMPAMTTGLKSMIFGDMSKYIVRKVGQPLIGAIQDKDFWPGFGIAGYIRFDGELEDTGAVKHLIQA
jgi:HK97 family phage major capsid protein